jgi:hypothetical protein
LLVFASHASDANAEQPWSMDDFTWSGRDIKLVDEVQRGPLTTRSFTKRGTRVEQLVEIVQSRP